MLPTTVSFDQLMEKKNGVLADFAIPWNDLPRSTVYQINSMKKIDNAVLLNLHGTVHGEINVWATEGFVKDLEKVTIPCFVNLLGTTWYLVSFKQLGL